MIIFCDTAELNNLEQAQIMTFESLRMGSKGYSVSLYPL